MAKRKKINEREEKLLSELSSQVGAVKNSVKKVSKDTDSKTEYLIGAYANKEEDKCVKQGSCVFFEVDPSCKWLRENGCASKCKIRALSNRDIGVDGNKIKYRPTREEAKLKGKLLKTLRQAQAIEDQIHRQEVVAALRARNKKMMELMWGIKSILKDDQSDDTMTEEKPTVSKYSNLKSLI